MPQTNRKVHWESIYTGKDPTTVSWYQREPAMSLQLIQNTKLPPTAPIIDIGGGASSLIDCLCTRGYTHLAVLDISSKALAHARSRLASKAAEVAWHEADVTEFDAPGTYSLWHDRAVFHFLTNTSERRKYVEVLKRTLKPGGHLLIAAFAIDGPKKCSGLDIVQYDAKKLLGEIGDEFQLVEEAEELHVTPAGNEQKFAYFRFIRKP